MREGGWGAGRLGGWRRAHLSLSITYLQRSHLRMRDGCSCRPECAGAARPQGASSRLPPGAQSPATGTGGGAGLLSTSQAEKAGCVGHAGWLILMKQTTVRLQVEFSVSPPAAVLLEGRPQALSAP